MNILLIYYHPVIYDLAKTLVKMGHKITVAINTEIKDNYGNGKDLIKNAKLQFQEFDVVELSIASVMIKMKKFDLVGCDGVFDGDDLIMSISRNNFIPYFCIQGYPGVTDEPSNNILSFGWFLPTFQYLTKFNHEGKRKNEDWKDIAEKGKSSLKNVCIFYPQCWEIRDNLYSTFEPNKFVSVIQRYQECNEWCYKVFEQFRSNFPNTQNIEGQTKDFTLKEIVNSAALIHLKQGDSPGMAVLEAMLFGKPVLTMKSFVLTSMNQDLLIDGYNAIVADTVEELLERAQDQDNLKKLGLNAREHSLMLTDFSRQKNKLKIFLENCQ